MVVKLTETHEIILSTEFQNDNSSLNELNSLKNYVHVQFEELQMVYALNREIQEQLFPHCILYVKH